MATTNEIGLRGSAVRDPARREEQRRQIVAAAARVFARKGYEASTMQDIAKEMGVSKGILYYQFKSKQDLIVETRVESSGRASERLEVIARKSLPAAARMELALRDLIASSFDEFVRHVITMPSRLGLDAEHAAQVRELEHRYERILTGIYREGVSEGSFVDAHVRLTMFTLIRAALAPAHWFRSGGDLSERQVVDGVTAQLMRSLGATLS